MTIVSPRSLRSDRYSLRHFVSLLLIVFVLGILVGLNACSVPEGEVSLNGYARSSSSLAWGNESHPDGWKTINGECGFFLGNGFWNTWHYLPDTAFLVFYGSADYVESKLPNNKIWHSQARQDEAVMSLLGGKRNGYFVDLAANDATTLSNTYALEKYFGWKGLCVEPNPDYFYNLSHYRENCDLVAAVVGRARMEQVFFYEAGDHSGILGFDNPERFKERSKQEYTVTLLEIFERFNVPKEIDYLSLDVEGAEDFILSAFPLENYEVKLMTIERPNKELQTFLESKGYKQMQRLSRWGETLWAHQRVHLDTSRLDEFNAKRQHLLAKAKDDGSRANRQ
eukprot:scaffold1909_cov130-Cylindrotheca_fusiformis.AAC.2